MTLLGPLLSVKSSSIPSSKHSVFLRTRKDPRLLPNRIKTVCHMRTTEHSANGRIRNEKSERSVNVRRKSNENDPVWRRSWCEVAMH